MAALHPPTHPGGRDTGDRSSKQLEQSQLQSSCGSVDSVKVGPGDPVNSVAYEFDTAVAPTILRARDAYVHSVDRALFTTIAAPERAASPETETTEKARTAEVTGCSRLRSGSRPLHPTFVIVMKSQMFRINSRRIHPYSYPYIGNRERDPEAET